MSKVYYMKEPKEYNGYDKLDIRDYHDFNTIEDFHEEVNLFNTPKYHLLRVCKVRGEDTYYNERCQFLVDYEGGEYDYKYVGSCKDDDITLRDFAKLLKSGAPKKHTICRIKQGFKASNTIHKSHLGHWYEFIAKKLTDSNICQAGPGRCSGYGFPEYYESAAIIRTNKDSCDRYISGFDNYVKMVYGGGFSTTSRNKYNKDSFNTVTNLPTSMGKSTFDFDDVFDIEEYENTVEEYEEGKLKKAKFYKYIKDTIEYFFDSELKVQSIKEEYKKKSIDRLNTKLDHFSTGKAFRIKNGRKPSRIITEAGKEKFTKLYPIGVRTFQCLPVYPNRDPEDTSLPKLLFVYIIYHKNENKKKEDIYDIWSKDFVNEIVDEFEAFYENLKQSKYTFKVFYKKYKTEMKARKQAEKEHREEIMRQRAEAVREEGRRIEEERTAGVKGEFGF